MSKKTKPETVAVIDIGSNELRLKVATGGKSSLQYLDSLIYPLSLGRDTFSTGKISYDKADKTCDIIKNFQTVAQSYGVTSLRTIATTAVREAQNKEYFLDQLMIKTGQAVQVIDDAEEKLYIYKLMCKLLTAEQKNSALMVYIGSGNIGISLLEEGRIPFIENIKVGTLRINEIFESIQDYSSEFYLVVEEYIRSFTDLLDDVIPEKVKNFVVSGPEISMVAELCKATRDNIFQYIQKDSFLKFYEEIKHKTVSRIATDYKLASDKAEVLLPAMALYKNLLEFTESDKIISPMVFLSDSIIYEMLFGEEFADINKDFNKNTLVCARTVAKRFNVMEDHSNSVERFALKIYDKMRKIRGLGQRHKLLLQTAAILHDIGKAVNIRSHYRHTYSIIKGLDIVGLNSTEIEIVANICLYHSRITPSFNDESYRGLDQDKRVLVSKLVAVLRIADALDRSHAQKLSDIDVKISDSELVVTVETDKNIDLEQWAFNDKSLFFEEVFGLKAILKKKRVT